MADKVVIITGASRGVGRAAAVELASRGCSVALVARSATDLAETADLCKRAGSRALAVAGDITDEPTLARLVNETADRFGRVDGVVNNAGLAPQAGVAETDAALFRRVIETNLTSAMTLSRLAWPHLTRQGGCIVNVSSMAAVDPLPGFVAYAAAKAGLVGMTKSLAQEVASRGITANCVAPGFIRSPMTDVLPDAQKEALNQRIPMGRMGSGEDIGAAVAYLASREAAYVTGQTLHVNGGMAMFA